MKRILLLLAVVLAAAPPAPASASDLTDRLEALAARDHGEALYHLGMIHHLGLEGVAVDHRRALDYFRRSAEAGDPLGAYKLGCYYAGQGEGAIAADPELALRYKLVGAEAGYHLAQIEVAQIYAGRDDHERALRWFDAAARQGDFDALLMALFQVAPESERPDRARAWLYYRAIMATVEQAPAADVPDADVREMRDAFAALRQIIEPGMSDADRAEGERLFSQWRVVRSPVTERADLRMNAARRLAGLPEVA
jgi:uncharacterized protein